MKIIKFFKDNLTTTDLTIIAFVQGIWEIINLLEARSFTYILVFLVFTTILDLILCALFNYSFNYYFSDDEKQND